MSDQHLRYKDLTPDVIGKISPMMIQYLKLKERNPGSIVMFRLGDFYEMFFDDAITVSAELSLTLTGRDCGLDRRAPMCGVPYHAVSTYINQLIQKGHRIALCEQMTDPALSNGLVEREVVKVITPGTLTDDEVLDEKSNNYIISVYCDRNSIGYAYADISTGSFYAGSFTGKKCSEDLANEMLLISPTEVLIPQSENRMPEVYSEIHSKYYVHSYGDKFYDFRKSADKVMKHFRSASLTGLGLADNEQAVCAAGALLCYLGETQMNTLRHVTKLNIVSDSQYMHLDDFTCSNLELIAPLRRDGSKASTLLNTLDYTQTAMGGRLIKEYILRPLQDKNAINARLDAVQELSDNPMLSDGIRECLRGICDIERLCCKLSSNALSPRNCVSIKYALSKIWEIKNNMQTFSCNALENICNGLDTLDDLRDLISAALVDEPPMNIRDGGAVRDGFDKMVDEYRSMTGNGKQWLSDLEQAEREKTGIKGLKIGYNRVFGYYFEVSKSFISQVPDRFIRKQTLANSERYFTDELKSFEEKTLTAESRCIDREVQIFSDIQNAVLSSLIKLQENAKLIAQLDVYESFATAAAKNNYIRPNINTNGIINIKQCRHPMVERNMKDAFNPNDVLLDMENNRAIIITGPNMAGKSTYMRQTALLVLMAHIGSFIPASHADVCIVDKIFTRVGASDNLSSGQSTFMVEMSEMACILNSATEKSLLILDEIGRGTATYDGLSIAWAVLEHIIKVTKAKTMFATHYHELTALENEYDEVRNYSVAVKEVGDNIVFLHKIINQGADRSFGIQVAALAGLPDEVVSRAKVILREHEGLLSAARGKTEQMSEEEKKKNLAAEELYEEVKAIDPDDLTPKMALNLIFRLKTLTNED